MAGIISFSDTAFTYESSLADSDRAAIRLLVLWPATEDNNEISITLSEHYFEECPPYEALSYVWGDASQRSTIICNGQPFSITSSLYRILKYLRGEDVRLLWIDQISIHQNDDREKGQQVGMMRDIYRRAKSTIAWLGDPRDSTSTAFETFRNLSKGRQAFSPALLKPGNPWAELSSESANTEYLVAIAKNPEKYWGVATPDRSATNAVLKMLASPWFTRMWIIQEATIPGCLTLQSGNNEMTMDELIFGFYVLQTMLISDRGNMSILSRGGTDMLETLTMCRYSHLAGDDLPIIDLICISRQFQATDQRDRLFALFGVTSSPLVDLGLSPDYSSQARHVLCSNYVKIMCEDQSLRLLELTETQSDSDLPSWIPHRRIPSDPRLYPASDLSSILLFSRELTITRVYRNAWSDQSNLDDDDDNEDDVEEATKIENPFEASVEETVNRQKVAQERMHANVPGLSISLHGIDVLCAQGQFLDRIMQVSAVAVLIGTTDQGNGKVTRDYADFVDWEGMDELDDDAGAREMFKAVRQGAGIMTNFLAKQMSEWKQYINALVDIDSMVTSRKKTAYYRSEEAILAAYRNTVTAGTLFPKPGEDVNEHGWNDQQSVNAFNKWRNTMKAANQINKIKRRLGMKNASGAASMIATSATAHATYDFDSKMMLGEAMKALPSRRLAWTARGHLAMVPANAAVNDHIFALRGSRMPFVLRPHEGNWKVLGPTYVDGMMNGELLDDDAVAPIKIV